MNINRLFPLVVLLVILVSLPLGMTLATQPVRTGTKAHQTGKVMVYFEVPSMEINTGEKFSVSLKIDSGEAVVNGLDGAIVFDATSIKLINVSTGPYFTHLALATFPDKVNLTATEKVSGKGTVANLTFLAVKAGPVTLHMSDQTNIMSADNTHNLFTTPSPFELVIH